MRRFPTAAPLWRLLRHPPLAHPRHTPSAGLWHTPPAHPSAHIGGHLGHAAVPNSGTPLAPPSAGLWHPLRRTPLEAPQGMRLFPTATPLWRPLRYTPSAGLWHIPAAGLWHTPPAHPSAHIGGLPGHAAVPNSGTHLAPPRQGSHPLQRTPSAGLWYTPSAGLWRHREGEWARHIEPPKKASSQTNSCWLAPRGGRFRSGA